MYFNQFADDPDFQYLALDRKRLQDEQAPYDAKSSCWIPDPNEGYMRSSVISTKGENVTVITDKGEVCFIERLLRHLFLSPIYYDDVGFQTIAQYVSEIGMCSLPL